MRRIDGPNAGFRHFPWYLVSKTEQFEQTVGIGGDNSVGFADWSICFCGSNQESVQGCLDRHSDRAWTTPGPSHLHQKSIFEDLVDFWR